MRASDAWAGILQKSTKKTYSSDKSKFNMQNGSLKEWKHLILDVFGVGTLAKAENVYLVDT